MQTSFHLDSAQDVNSNILDAIKNLFKSKSITITVEENDEIELDETLINDLNQRLEEDEENYISAKDSIQKLKNKYGI